MTAQMAKSAFWLLCGGLLVLTAIGVVGAQSEAGPATPQASPVGAGVATPLQLTPAGIAARVGGQQAAAQATIAAYATREAQQAAASATREAQHATEIAQLQGLVADAQVTVTALAVVAANTVLDPTPETLTIQTDLNGMLGENPDTLSAARAELMRQLSRYPLGCRAGFVLVSSKAPGVDFGVVLSERVMALLREVRPEVFDESTGDALFALPNVEPFGEVEIEVFFYSGCEPIE